MSLRMIPRARLAGWAALAIWAFSAFAGPSCRAQVAPEESARKLKPAEGLEATLWASEPMIANPTNMDVDSRGRVWITEGLNYRLSRGANKKLPKIEEADRIKVLEDTDGDGKADKMTVFADHIFPVPMGIAVEERYGKDGKYLGCKVYVGNSPDLLVFEDTDGDDKADKRYPLLTGFGGIDSDHGVHGMTLGLDGKLYFTHGDGCCSVQHDHSEKVQNFDVIDKSGRHVWSDQLANTLRVNRDGTQFEVLCDRQRNNYETCLNAFGNGFTSDNDDDGNRGCRVIGVMDGGHYGYRTPGSPRHWGEDVPGNVPKLVGTGNGSPCGIMVYEGALLPEEYRGGLLEAEAGTRQINFFPLTRHGSTFRTDSKVFLGSDDPWFRPVDMTAAPDGAVFVADWYDSAVGGHSFRDQDTGRIYRVAPKGAKPKAVAPDFATVRGLAAALTSPVVATQDAARRLLIERAATDRQQVEPELVKLFTEGRPTDRARALWVLSAIAGDAAARDALADRDPRIREQAVRILGRDDRENGHVEYNDPKAKLSPPALAHLDALRPLAADPDPGVRRELVLALRTLPTAQVGEALKALTRAWDGQDRWYLEALGLALDHREAEFVSALFDGALYGDLDLDDAGQAGQVALPPYFPDDRNEAYIAEGTKDLPASPLSRTLGLAWRLHRPEVLPLLGRILPKLASPEMQQAADDVLAQMKGPETAVVLAELAARPIDPARRGQILSTLARKLDGDWRAARDHPKVVAAIEAALGDPEMRLEGVAVAAATGDARYGPAIMGLAQSEKAPDALRAAAIEALGRLKPLHAREFLNRLIATSEGRNSSTASAEAAVRTLPQFEDASRRLADMIVAKEYPLGLRREALRTFGRLGQGPARILELARAEKLPADLRTEATTLLNSHPDRRIREEAAHVLPLPKTAGGRRLPSLFDLVRRVSDGKPDRGRAVFFQTGPNLKDRTVLTSCGGCHRVQGRGQWVGPDLSTIGTKYGPDELIRSILNPSAAIGYNEKTQVVALKDGQVWSGLLVEDLPDRLVLKTSEGKRVVIRPGDIEERATSDVSLMPEGLAETISDQDLVDLIAFLATLRQPVSIVGQYHVIGPVAEEDGAPAFDPAAQVDLAGDLRGPEGRKLAWRRLDANAEGLIDLGALSGGDPKRAVYASVPVLSPVEQDARLVLDTRADVKVWLNGKPVTLSPATENEPRAAAVTLPKGPSALRVRIAGGPNATLVTTFVAGRSLVFRADEVKASER